MKYLVIGSEGFIGKALCRALRSGADCTLIKIDIAKSLTDDKYMNQYNIDLTDTGTLVSLCEKERPDIVFNLAGAFSSSSFQDLFSINCFAPIAFLEASVHLDFKLVLIGSAAEYGITKPGEIISEAFPLKPISPYGVSKACQAHMALSHARKNTLPHVVIARLFNIIGPGIHSTLFLGDFARQVVNIEDGNKPPVVTVGDLECYRDLLSVEKVADCLKAVGHHGERGEVYNICSSQPSKIEDVLYRLLKLARMKIDVEIDRTRFKVNDIPWSVGDSNKISRLASVSFSFDEMDRSIQDTLDWYRENSVRSL